MYAIGYNFKSQWNIDMSVKVRMENPDPWLIIVRDA